MARKSAPDPDPDPARGIGGFVDRLNRSLFPWLGPPPLGPYDDPPASTAPAVCPICRSPMAEHSIDRSGPRTLLTCP
ncbi:MAG: hypothetical protein ABWZ77_02875 [Naasia sp.]